MSAILAPPPHPGGRRRFGIRADWTLGVGRRLAREAGDRASLGCALAGGGGAGDSMLARAGETVVLAAPGLFHGEGEQPARRCLETGEGLP